MRASSYPFILSLVECTDVALVGGKAVNLGALLRADFPVPGGFCVTTAAYASRDGSNLPPELADAIRTAYRGLGGGPVAVRSSATAEDAAGASMAGQYDTFLHVDGESALLDAVRRCWLSLDTPRTRAYLAGHGIDAASVAMAVVVQRLVLADVAGVLFTANPQSGARDEMLIEATWGLGESLVGGRVQPDVLRVERATGRVIEQRVADKRTMIPAAGNEDGEVETPAELRSAACLSEADARRLVELGRRAAEHFGAEQDVEWATEAGRHYLLQSRPITTLDEADAARKTVADERESLRRELSAGKGPWVRHNLGETLPHPTPLTWSVVQPFMTGGGGFGAMYRLAGFEPSADVTRDGFLRLIAGRVYMDASAAGGMYFDGFPFRYDLEALRTNPDAPQSPPPVPTGTLKQRWRAGRRIAAANRRLERGADVLDHHLRHDVFPAFAAWVAAEKRRDLSTLSPSELADLWDERRRRVMDEFAPWSLLPGLVEGMALADLRQTLAETIWDEDPAELATALSSSPVPNMTLLADAALYEAAAGRRTVEQWLAKFGHRGPGEFDLAEPRWREMPIELRATAARLAGGADPIELHERRAAAVRERAAGLRARMTRADAETFNRRLDRVWRYIVFREDGKYFLMLGYDLLRDVALEAGRRLGVGDGVFFLTQEEMKAALRAVLRDGIPPLGANLGALVASRKLRHRGEARVSLPHLIDAAAIDALGTPPKLSAAGTRDAFAVSAGVATGPARVVLSPTDADDLGRGYVLVCPSTDPNWTPLFVNAAALVLERGGTLSHGAVVAREMGLPAVVLPDATRIFTDGDVLRVDGHHGTVGPAGDPVVPPRQDTGGDAHDPNDVRIDPSLVPPSAGRIDRRATRLAWWSALGWGVYLLLAFVLPERLLYQPSLRLLDRLLWWMVPAFGHWWTVAIVSAAVAAIVMLLQRLLTDNDRLREAKRRSNLLAKRAARMDPDSPRRRAIAAVTAPVSAGTFAAAIVPLAVFLGPMVMTFLWMPVRVDPASWNRPADTGVVVVATPVAGASGAVTIELPPDFKLDAARTPSPVQPIADVSAKRAALEELLARLDGSPANVPTDRPLEKAADEVRAAGKTPAELRAFLAAGVRPPAVSWTVRPPAGQTGRWPIHVRGPDGRAFTAYVVLGDRNPPEPLEVPAEDSSAAVDAVRLSYPSVKPVPFWQPFRTTGWKWAGWDAGWLGVYLLAYLPAMVVARRVFRVA